MQTVLLLRFVTLEEKYVGDMCLIEVPKGVQYVVHALICSLGWTPGKHLWIGFAEILQYMKH